MRSLLVVILLALGGVLALLSNLGLWVDRTVYDTDGFVSTVGGVLDDEDVQQVMAERFTEELFEAADIEDRLQAELPEGLKFLSLPLSNAARDFLTDASVRLLERERFQDVRDRALRETHSLLIAIIEDDSGAITTEDGKLVLDLRPIVEAVAEDITGRDVNLPQDVEVPQVEIPQEVLDQLPPDVRERLQTEGEEGLLSGLQLPDDAGRFVIEDATISWAYNIARYGNDIVYVTVGVTVACYVLAIAIARDRRSTLRTAGIVMAVAGVISLALLLPLGQAARQFAENDAAATSILNIVTSGYKSQSLAMVGVGIGFVAVAVLLGDSPLAVAVRSAVRRRPGGPSLAAVIRERVAALRIAGLVGAAGVLIVWPDPTARVYLTTLGLLALYLVGLLLLESDAPWAKTARERVQRFWQEQTKPGAAVSPEDRSIGAWIARHAGSLRLIGIIVAIALLLLWPSMSLRMFIVVVALGFIYLAGIDLVAGRSDKSGSDNDS